MKTQPLLLVAEDDPDDQVLIQDAITFGCLAGTRTHFVWDGVELIEYLREMVREACRPGLLVLDLNMPRKDGREALREIRMDPALAAIPVAVLTTSTNDRDALFCRQHGVSQYFCKPSSMDELRDIMGGLCEKYLGVT